MGVTANFSAPGNRTSEWFRLWNRRSCDESRYSLSSLGPGKMVQTWYLVLLVGNGLFPNLTTLGNSLEITAFKFLTKNSSLGIFNIIKVLVACKKTTASYL